MHCEHEPQKKLYEEAERFAAYVANDPLILKVILYGSVARDDTKPDSDIDFYLVTNENRHGSDFDGDWWDKLQNEAKTNGFSLGVRDGQLDIKVWPRNKYEHPTSIGGEIIKEQLNKDGVVLFEQD